MTDTPPTSHTLRPDRRLTVYMSQQAWEALQFLMGPDGKPSPTINHLILEAAKRQDLISKK